MEHDINEEIEFHHAPERLQKEHDRLNVNCVEVSFEAIQINEIVLLQDFVLLLEGLDKLYSSTSKIDKNNYHKRNLKEWLYDDRILGKQFLPTLYSKDFPGIKSNLPDGIEFIKIDIQKDSSEFISLNISFFINDEVNKDFTKLLNRIDKPTIVNNYFLEGEITIYPVRKTKETNIEELILGIKRKSIIYLSRFLFFGEFYKKDSEDYFKNFPSINVFSFVGDNESLLANGDLLGIIGLHFIDSRRYSLEGKYFFSLKEDLSNTSTLVINRGDDWENGFKLHMLKESFFSYLGILIYLELLDNNIQGSISCIFSATLIQEEKINEQKKLIGLIHIFNRIRSSVERMRFEKIGLLTIKKCECCDNDFSKEYEEKIKKFIKQQSKLYNQSLSSIEGLVTLENTYENKKLQNKIFWLTIGMAFMVFIQVMLIEYNNKVLFKYIFN